MKSQLPDVWHRNPWAEIPELDCPYCGALATKQGMTHFARCPVAHGWDSSAVADFHFELENLRRQHSGRPPVRRVRQTQQVVRLKTVRPLRSHSVRKLAARIARGT